MLANRSPLSSLESLLESLLPSLYLLLTYTMRGCEVSLRSYVLHTYPASVYQAPVLFQNTQR